MTEKTLEELANAAGILLADARSKRDAAIEDADNNPDAMPFTVG
jgi:hypothetical protein